MKRILGCLLAVLLLSAAALSETSADTVRLEFENGFSLSLPSGWVSFAVAPELKEAGFAYCLGSTDAAHLMYIQHLEGEYANFDALRAVFETRPEIVLRSTVEAASGRPFLLYNFAEEDCSGCAALYEDSVINLLFLPRSDADFMLTAAAIIDSAN